mmetsp:Transcript_34019/g.76586  ORF Transcript_34019/g.76586 Transcript_34019/m.76586 type:complete len:232 (+) Transcript_34019:2320-3015(+)
MNHRQLTKLTVPMKPQVKPTNPMLDQRVNTNRRKKEKNQFQTMRKPLQLWEKWLMQNRQKLHVRTVIRMRKRRTRQRKLTAKWRKIMTKPMKKTLLILPKGRNQLKRRKKMARRMSKNHLNCLLPTPLNPLKERILLETGPRIRWMRQIRVAAKSRKRTRKLMKSKKPRIRIEREKRMPRSRKFANLLRRNAARPRKRRPRIAKMATKELRRRNRRNIQTTMLLSDTVEQM